MANEPEVKVLEMLVVDTEYPTGGAGLDVTNENYITVKCRDTTSTIRMAFVTGQVASNVGASTQKYITINPGGSYNMDNASKVVALFFASSDVNSMVEVELWDAF